MTVHWMMNNPWPSVFGHLFDYYFKPGGGYFGAKKGLRPRTIVWDYYATGDRSTSKIYVVNQTDQPQEHEVVSVAYYALDGTRKYFNQVKDVAIAPHTSAEVMSVARIKDVGPVYFVKCELRDPAGNILADNSYWSSSLDDDLGDPKNDLQFKTDLAQWGDLSALNTMPRASVKASAVFSTANNEGTATVTLTNTTNRIAFFVRAVITQGPGGNEILPITYSDNYVTLFPEESKTIVAHFEMPLLTARAAALSLEGYNVDKQVLSLK
jgi:exo-1,4-beta-D-glucosaminidase